MVPLLQQLLAIVKVEVVAIAAVVTTVVLVIKIEA
jgi:hypothetical protein